jgi:hypothetical protein
MTERSGFDCCLGPAVHGLAWIAVDQLEELNRTVVLQPQLKPYPTCLPAAEEAPAQALGRCWHARRHLPRGRRTMVYLEAGQKSPNPLRAPIL